MPNLRLRIVVGQNAQPYHPAGRTRETLTETVGAWWEFAPNIYPLPHPSPRNQMWILRNSWFTTELLPTLRVTVQQIMGMA